MYVVKYGKNNFGWLVNTCLIVSINYYIIRIIVKKLSNIYYIAIPYFRKYLSNLIKPFLISFAALIIYDHSVEVNSLIEVVLNSDETFLDTFAGGLFEDVQ